MRDAHVPDPAPDPRTGSRVPSAIGALIHVQSPSVPWILSCRDDCRARGACLCLRVAAWRPRDGRDWSAAAIDRRAHVDARSGAADYQRRAARANRTGAPADGAVEDRRADAGGRHVDVVLREHALGRQRAIVCGGHSGQGRPVLRLPCLRARSRAGADRARPVRRRDSRYPHVAGRREPLHARRAGVAGPRDCHGTARRRGDRQVRLRQQRGRRRSSTEGRERDAHHGRLPDDQGRTRNRADATRVSGYAESVRGRATARSHRG